jgi:hypothetical protein
VHRKVPAGFGGRLRGKGPHPPSRARDLAAQPIRFQERDSRSVPADPDDTGEPGDTQAGGGDPGGGGPGGGGPGGPDNGPAGDRRGGGRARQPGQDTGPSFGALVNITVPWSALTGQSGALADVAGFGLVDADDARDLAAAAARDPRTRWCVTLLHPDGTAAAHGCAVGRHPPPRGPTPGPDPPPGTSPQDWISRLHITMTPIARGTCDHDRAEPGYKPSRKLQHLVRTRNTRCTAPGCGRPAGRCDLDHTIAWQQGGLTCECDLAPLCRHHHRCKQSQGWKLEQPSPGVLVWHTPAGRTYVTRPSEYPA